MKTLEKKVYYCDHCKKHMLTTYGMKKHESKCLYNPKRMCTAPYCLAGIGINQELIDWVKENASLNYDGSESSISEISDDKIQELRDRLEGCPVCTLAVLLQTKRQLKSDGDDIYWMYADFKKDAEEMFSTYQSENAPWY